MAKRMLFSLAVVITALLLGLVLSFATRGSAPAVPEEPPPASGRNPRRYPAAGAGAAERLPPAKLQRAAGHFPGGQRHPRNDL